MPCTSRKSWVVLWKKWLDERARKDEVMIFKNKNKITAGIIGGAGYGGTELIKLLLFHPKVNLCFVTSRKYAGSKISSVNRFLSGVTELKYIEPDVSRFPPGIDLFFLAAPHGTSMNLVPEIIKAMPRSHLRYREGVSS